MCSDADVWREQENRRWLVAAMFQCVFCLFDFLLLVKLKGKCIFESPVALWWVLSDDEKTESTAAVVGEGRVPTLMNGLFFVTRE